MRRIASGAFAALMGLTIASSASASTLNITNIIGDWIALSVVPPGGAAIVNVAGQGTDTIRWPAAGGSGADFTPSADIIGVAVNMPFALGTFVHHNFPTSATITDVDYTFGFTTNGVPPGLGDTFHLAVLDTPNAPGGCAPGSISVCDDYITVSSLTLNSVITVGPDTYYFSVLGFSQNGGVTISNVFQTQENAANTSLLYAVVTDQPIGTPEPGTLLLVGSGALAAARRRRKSKV